MNQQIDDDQKNSTTKDLLILAGLTVGCILVPWLLMKMSSYF